MMLMDKPVKPAVTLSAEQRRAYSLHLMPYHTPPGALHLKSGKGMYFEDVDGKRYLDFTAQMFACYLGMGNEELAEAIYEQARMFTVVAPHIQTDLRYALAYRLAAISPEHLNRVAFSVGGGPALESAMKIALKNVKGSRNFVTLWGAYHGGTFASVAATFETTRHQAPEGNSLVLYNQYAGYLNNNCVRAPHPYCYRCPFGLSPDNCRTFCAEALRQAIINGVMGPLAGVIMEPMQSAGGEFPLPRQYLVRAREICDEFGALLIFDEIQCFARTGKWFAAEYYGVEPDVIIMGKGVGSGAPISGIIIHDRLTPFEDAIEDLHTHQNNHIGFAGALKTLEIIERDRLLENAETMGRYMQEKLRDMQKRFPEIGDIRGAGLKIGVELVKDPKTRAPLRRAVSNTICRKSMEKGLMFQLTGHSIIKIKPALIVQKEHIDEAMGILEESLREVLRV
jgi:4-aminobutyrate aminotransferase-like enzyme